VSWAACVFEHVRSPNQKSPVLEAILATNEFTSREHEGLYRLVIVLNSSLRLMTLRLEEMATLKVLSVEYIREMRRLTERIEKEMT
jgi:hypothetical protein